MSEVSKFLDSVSGGKYNTGLVPTASNEVAPIVGLNGFSGASLPSAQSDSTQASNPTLSGGSTGTGSLFSGSQLSTPSTHYQYDGNSRTSNPIGGNAGIGGAISGLGMLGQITHNPTFSQAAGLAGTINGVANGNYTGLGSLIGNFSGVANGGLLGAALGSYLSPADNTARMLANAGVSMIPGLGQAYSIGNVFTSGALSNALFGKDAAFGDTGQFSPATPGALANLGSANATRVYGTGDNAVSVSNGGGNGSNGNGLSSADRGSIAAANGYGGGV